MKKSGNIYLREWFNFALENPHKTDIYQSGLYAWLIDKWNRTGNKDFFTFQTEFVIETLQISRDKLTKCIKDLTKNGFIIVQKKPTNQSNINWIISLPLAADNGRQAIPLAADNGRQAIPLAADNGKQTVRQPLGNRPKRQAEEEYILYNNNSYYYYKDKDKKEEGVEGNFFSKIETGNKLMTDEFIISLVRRKGKIEEKQLPKIIQDFLDNCEANPEVNFPRNYKESRKHFKNYFELMLPKLGEIWRK